VAGDEADECGCETLIHSFGQGAAAEAANGYEFPYGRGTLTRFGVWGPRRMQLVHLSLSRRGALLRYDCYNRNRPIMTVEIRRCFF